MGARCEHHFPPAYYCECMCSTHFQKNDNEKPVIFSSEIGNSYASQIISSRRPLSTVGTFWPLSNNFGLCSEPQPWLRMTLFPPHTLSKRSFVCAILPFGTSAHQVSNQGGRSKQTPHATRARHLIPWQTLKNRSQLEWICLTNEG